MIKAEVVLKSNSGIAGIPPITTLLVTMPRYILAEFNTHRAFSRNSASSRAIPFEKMVKTVEDNPFIPIAWQLDHKGMQGNTYITDEENIYLLRANHLEARDVAIYRAKVANKMGATKQLCNRYLEPFMWTTVLTTSVEWENFFDQRCPQYELENQQVYRSKKEAIKTGLPTPFEDDILGWLEINRGQAEIHMMAVAECIYDAINGAEGKPLNDKGWHIPFITVGEEVFYSIEEQLFISTARCARTSYTTIDSTKALHSEDDLKLGKSLLLKKHWSPFEHQAKVISDVKYCKGNFSPYYEQWRHLL